MSHVPGGRPPEPPPPPPPSGGRGGAGENAGDPAWPNGRAADGAHPADAFRVPFSIVDGMLAVLWFIAAAPLLVVLPAFEIGLLEPGSGGVSLLLVQITSQAVGLAGVLAWLSFRGGLSWRLAGPARPRPVHWVAGLGIGVGAYAGANILLATLLQLLGPVEPPDQVLLSEVTAGGLVTVLALVSGVVLAPVVEEVIFRGVLFQALKRRTGLWPATLLTSIVFAIVHVEVSQPLYSGALALLGVVFALTLHRTGTLLVPIVAHAAFNLISFTLAITQVAA